VEVTGWVVAVANTYASAAKAAAALKIAYDGGPNAKLSSQSLLDEAKRLQALDESGQVFGKDVDTPAALGSGPILNVHARSRRETLAGVICVSGECRVPARSRLYIGQSAAADDGGVGATWAKAERAAAVSSKPRRERIRLQTPG
jgi:hypothetical protein